MLTGRIGLTDPTDVNSPAGRKDLTDSNCHSAESISAPAKTLEDSLRKIPCHVAFVPDGNTRWARVHNLSLVKGYEAGVQAVDKITAYANQIGIGYLTFYLLSLENVRRRSDPWLLNFFEFAKTAIRDFSKRVRQYKIVVIGNTSYLPDFLQNELNELVDQTKDNSGIVLILAVAYSGQDEILRAINALLRARLSADSALPTTSALNASPITISEFSQYLDMKNIPPPDLLIRSANEFRLSGFLLWHLDYTELAFAPEFWPDFSINRFREILQDYQQRPRYFGRERS
jgi:undecaprenyl diphosphate synthase